MQGVLQYHDEEPMYNSIEPYFGYFPFNFGNDTSFLPVIFIYKNCEHSASHLQGLAPCYVFLCVMDFRKFTSTYWILNFTNLKLEHFVIFCFLTSNMLPSVSYCRTWNLKCSRQIAGDAFQIGYNYGSEQPNGLIDSTFFFSLTFSNWKILKSHLDVLSTATHLINPEHM